MPTLLIRVDGSSFEILNLYGLKFVASDCRIDDTADIARCKTIEDPSKAGKIVTPTALEIASEIRPDGTPVAFSGFPVNGLIPYTARANIAGYQVVEMSPKQGLHLRMLVLDKPAWPGSSGGPGLWGRRSRRGNAAASRKRLGLCASRCPPKRICEQSMN